MWSCHLETASGEMRRVAERDPSPARRQGGGKASPTWSNLSSRKPPQRGTGGWGPQVGGRRGHKAIHRGHFGPLEEVEMLLRGQAGTGRTGGECQQGRRRRKRQGRKENQRSDRGIRVRRENKRQRGLSCTSCLICQEPALRASPVCVPPGSPSMALPALLQAGSKRPRHWNRCGAAIATPFPFHLMLTGLAISTRALLA